MRELWRLYDSVLTFEIQCAYLIKAEHWWDTSALVESFWTLITEQQARWPCASWDRPATRWSQVQSLIRPTCNVTVPFRNEPSPAWVRAPDECTGCYGRCEVVRRARLQSGPSCVHWPCPWLLMAALACFIPHHYLWQPICLHVSPGAARCLPLAPWQLKVSPLPIQRPHPQPNMLLSHLMKCVHHTSESRWNAVSC